MRKVFFSFLILFTPALSGAFLQAQERDSLVVGEDTVIRVKKHRPAKEILRTADSLRLDYDFAGAVKEYSLAKEAAADTVLKAAAEDGMTLAQNGLNMMSYCNRPVVVTKQKFSLKDFFLFYPLPDESWRKTPNALDSLGNGSIVPAMYIPDNEKTIYFTAKDENGIRNIYRTDDQDSLWTVPELLGEQLTSSSDEIFPMLTTDGKSLYFASKGLYGMGGYDLYVSRWNKERREWDVPVNLGFPYSSPYDDFLFVNTPDGKYSMFASNRECSKDSVYIYVLEFDSMPVRTAVSSAEELKELSLLNPEDDPSRMDNGSLLGGSESDSDTEKYTKKMAEVRMLRDSIYAYGHTIDLARSRLADISDPEEKASLAESIRTREARLPVLQDSLSAATKQLQEIEMEFLANGLVIDPEKVQKKVDREVVGTGSGYTFTRNRYGKPFEMKLQKPKPSFDYTLMVLPEGRFAENNTLPEGLVYQIQLFTQSRKATVSDLKGLSPVFERMNPSLTYTCYAGLFRSYKDVLSQLNKVKSRGFRTAIIAAFNNGKRISIKEARELEKTVHELFQIRIYPEDGNALSEHTIAAIRSLFDYDLSKVTDNGAVSYVLGPFDSRSEADEAAASLKMSGISNFSVESAGVKE